MIRRLECCEDITSITAIIDLDYIDPPKCSVTGKLKDINNAFQVVVKGSTGSYTFICLDPGQKKSWIDSFQTLIININKLRKENSGGKNKDQAGWEHEILRTGIHSAAMRGDEEMTDNILSSIETAIAPSADACSDPEISVASIIETPDASGLLPLHYAVRHRRLAIVQMLLEAGANPNKISSEYKAAAQYCENTHDKNLVGAGADREILKALDLYGSLDAKAILTACNKTNNSSFSSMVMQFSKTFGTS